ncbi:hypothetical protein [Bergeriella denitrificans]|uniref:hypothetical protein n=1 Tax=Bergeriella denitrificans TaxID=494 RepID=UPI0011C01C6D|nr:hypothetical protein [Bergeriella denitrificans]
MSAMYFVFMEIKSAGFSDRRLVRVGLRYVKRPSEKYGYLVLSFFSHGFVVFVFAQAETGEQKFNTLQLRRTAFLKINPAALKMILQIAQS